MTKEEKFVQDQMAKLAFHGIWFEQLEFALHRYVCVHKAKLDILDKAIDQFIEGVANRNIQGDLTNYFKTSIRNNYRKIEAIESYRPKTIEEQMEQARKEVLKWKTFEDIDKWFDKWDFEPHRIIYSNSKIQTLYDVGLSYIKLGQPSTTLSGGEAQRVKLATELSKKATGKTLYILDEPTTGLHIAEVQKLVDILQRLVDTGNTIIVIEHNLDLIKTCDHIIDLGPEGGDNGGEVVAVGTPEQICNNERSYTGKFLKKYLNK